MRLAMRILAALLVLPGALRASEVKTAKKQVGRLQQSADLSGDFSNIADGSISRKGGVTAASALPAQAAAGRKECPLPPGRPFARPAAPGIPEPLLDHGQIRQLGKKPSEFPVPWDALTLGLALGGAALMLLGATREAARPEKPRAAPDASPPSFTKAPARPAPAPRPEPSIEPPAEAFVDTRMPVSTWRAISLAEQQLIEKWDRSPEKAAGLASLEQWLDSQAGLTSVDVRLLKRKLLRDV